MATSHLRRTLAALALALIAATPASADVYDDNPAAASRNAGDIHVFARAANGNTLWRSYNGSSWTDWSSLGGTATSGPAAAAYNTAVNVFVRGGDGAVHQTSYVGGKWTPWASLGGFASSAPAATQRRGALNYFDVAVRGSDNQIYLNTWVPSAGWAGWSGLGGNWSSAPALNSQGDGILNVFVRGPDCAVWQKAWNGSAWSDWISLGGCIVGAPSVVSRTGGEVDLYAQAPGGAVWQRHFDPSAGWGGWFQLDPAAVDSPVGVASDHPLRELLFARKGSHLSAKVWNGPGGWTRWRDFGEAAVPPPPAPPAPTPAPVPLPDGAVNLQTGVRCTPPGGRLRVSVTIKKPKGKAKPRVAKIVFYTKGQGRKIRTDRKAPFQVHLRINRPAGSTGRVYARVHYKRTAGGKTYRKVVSRRYKVCR